MNRRILVLVADLIFINWVYECNRKKTLFLNLKRNEDIKPFKGIETNHRILILMVNFSNKSTFILQQKSFSMPNPHCLQQI